MKAIIVRTISYLLILLFLYAAANKLLDYQKFTVQIGQSPILIGYAGILAWFVPAVEIIIACLLFRNTTLLIGLYASYGLMAMFTGYIIVILNFAERVPCSCGGILDKMGWHEHLIFNAIFTLLPLLAIFLHTNRHTVTNPYKNFFGQETGLAENL